jgi:hypothetical protein
MSEILFYYEKVNPTTWVYLSSLLMIGLYFKFGRIWSVRNLDLLLLMLLAPGLLIAQVAGGARLQTARMIAMEPELRQPPPLPSPGPDATAADPEVLGSVEELLLPDEVSGSFSPEEVSELVGPPPPTIEDPEIGLPEIDDDDQEQMTPEEEAALRETQRRDLEDRLDRSIRYERIGYLWLFAVGALFLIRLLVDPTMVRRPLLEPNLTEGGLTFIGISLFVFLMANVWTSSRVQLKPLEIADQVQQIAGDEGAQATGEMVRRGPGYALLNIIPSIPTMPPVAESVDPVEEPWTYTIVAKVIVVLCHLAVMLGIVGIGYWHFGSVRTGTGVATLYLMLPYTAQMTGHIDHALPAALLVWAVLCYRRPLTAGLFLGLATSLVYYPLFLLPLWISFYWRRGLARFVIGVSAAMVVMAIALVFIPDTSYLANLQQMFGLWLPMQKGLEGIWALGWNPVYRMPVLAAFVALSGTLAIWPPQKNLGTLLSCSAAVMVATQFWHGFGGGLYMGWYLPLALLTIFRPNLEDRVALAVLGEGWVPRRNTALNGGFKAA